MSCEDIRNLALLSACGEAGEAEAASVREHASKCAACAVEIRSLNDGLELLKHIPREAPSREAREALGSMLLREAPRPATRPVRGLAIAAAVLMAVTATALAWKLGAWGNAKPVVVARGKEKKVVEPAPVATQEPKRAVTPTKVRKPDVATSVATSSFTNNDFDDLVEAVKELRTAARPDPSSVWYGKNSTAVDSLYDTLDELTTSPDKF